MNQALLEPILTDSELIDLLKTKIQLPEYIRSLYVGFDAPGEPVKVIVEYFATKVAQ